jgi:hypothetical protein
MTQEVNKNLREGAFESKTSSSLATWSFKFSQQRVSMEPVETRASETGSQE